MLCFASVGGKAPTALEWAAALDLRAAVMPLLEALNAADEAIALQRGTEAREEGPERERSPRSGSSDETAPVSTRPSVETEAASVPSQFALLGRPCWRGAAGVVLARSPVAPPSRRPRGGSWFRSGLAGYVMAPCHAGGHAGAASCHAVIDRVVASSCGARHTTAPGTLS